MSLRLLACAVLLLDAAAAQLMEDSLIGILQAKRFFELWRAEPEFSRMFARRLARKLDPTLELTQGKLQPLVHHD